MSLLVVENLRRNFGGALWTTSRSRSIQAKWLH
jgi:hypothetical protein